MASRILRRSGFGTTGVLVDAAVNSGEPDSYVGDLLAEDFAKDPGVVATPMPELESPDLPAKSAKSEYRRFFEKLSEQRQELTLWWIRRMVAAEQPMGEKLTFLWHNHFATSSEKVQRPSLMARQNEKLRRLCLGDFRTLARAMLTDAAMIMWLDGHHNKARSPNENLSREFIELFALGHGNGYTETDVREGARALTGWTAARNGDVELVARNHDDSIKAILDTRGNIDAEGLCDIVVAEPASARFVAGRLWQQLASDDPPPRETLQRLVAAYGPDRDLRALTFAILTDPDFLGNTATVVTSPVDWLIGLLRAFRVDIDEPNQAKTAVAVLRSLGQQPFYPPDVGGWPRGQAWLSTSAASIRLRTANRLARDGDVSLVADSPVGDRIDAAGYLIGIGAWSDRTVKAMKPLRKNPASLVAAAVNTPEYLTS